MALTRPIPRAARSIVRRIRKDVPKPGKRMFSYFEYDGLRTKKGCCPMGLLSYATHGTPHWSSHFLDFRVSGHAVTLFGEWWDEQDDTEAAVNAVWGKA